MLIILGKYLFQHKNMSFQQHRKYFHWPGILFPKTKPISIGITYKRLNQTRFLEQIITEFKALGLNDEHYILEDCYINPLFEVKWLLTDQTKFCKFLKNFLWIKQNMLNFVWLMASSNWYASCPTRIASNNYTLINHILRNTLLL